MTRRHILLFAITFFIAASGCTKQGEKVSETVTIHDTITLPSLISDTVTTIIIVRHAEKDTISGNDPFLTQDGIARADELKRILQQVNVNKIYSTPYNRTKQTVQPLSSAKGITITEYAASLPFPQLTAQLLAENKNKVAVVVGHSNTVPSILQTFNSSFVVTIADSQYDNLFVVTAREGKTPQVLHLKYGKPTP